MTWEKSSWPRPQLWNPWPQQQSYPQLQQAQSSPFKKQIISWRTGSYLLVKMRKSLQSLYEIKFQIPWTGTLTNEHFTDPHQKSKGQQHTETKPMFARQSRALGSRLQNDVWELTLHLLCALLRDLRDRGGRSGPSQPSLHVKDTWFSVKWIFIVAL